MKRILYVIVLLAAGLALVGAASAGDPLPSWNEGPAKQAILDFVKATTDQASPKFVAPAERIAVFDNDGTLWVEHPMYTQLAFALDRVKALAPKHPEWREKSPFKDVLDNNLPALAASGKQGLMELIMATHAGMTTQEFDQIVTDWLATTRHPRFKRPYTELVYQPMLELLGYLRANGFKTFIVSGGGVAFMRPWTEGVYGIPPEQVVGSRIAQESVVQDGEPALVRKPEIAFIDDKAGKPVGIQDHIGRRPILAFGNSDGDYQMLEWTTAGPGRRLGLILHHDDAEREYAYDRDSHFGKLSKGLDDAASKGWVLVSMKTDWAQVFPEVEAQPTQD